MGDQGKAKNVVIKMLSAAGTGCVLAVCFHSKMLSKRGLTEVSLRSFFYTTTKNPRNVTRKLSLRKVRRHASRLGWAGIQ